MTITIIATTNQRNRQAENIEWQLRQFLESNIAIGKWQAGRARGLRAVALKTDMNNNNKVKCSCNLSETEASNNKKLVQRILVLLSARMA